jgi:hypothetical protein
MADVRFKMKNDLTGEEVEYFTMRALMHELKMTRKQIVAILNTPKGKKVRTQVYWDRKPEFAYALCDVKKAIVNLEHQRLRKSTALTT